jgi:ubiquinone/menaquinone biosynthesis C-methylase UbiE
MFHTLDDARFWDRIAPGYAADPISDASGYEKSLERTISHLRMTDQVLELGCGTGTTALRLAPHVSRLLATDSSAAMIEIARGKAEVSPRRNIEFRQADAGREATPENSYDVVLGFNLLHLVRDRRGLLDKIRAVLKPGGLFISKTPCLSDMNPIIRLALPVMRMVGKAPYAAFFSAAELEAEIKAAGFDVIEVGRHATKGKDTRPYLVARRPAVE